MQLSQPIIDERVRPQGADIAVTFAENVQLTYWDLWCLLSAHQKFAGSLLALRTFLIDQRINERFYGSFRRDAAQDLIFLIEDLEMRLSSSEKTVDGVLALLSDRIKNKEIQKAIRNVIELSGSYPPSEPMLRSPRRALKREAFRGSWTQLPIDPTPVAERLLKLFIPKKKPGYFTKGTTSALVSRIEKNIEKELCVGGLFARPSAQRYAVYRAALTLFQEENCCVNELSAHELQTATQILINICERAQKGFQDYQAKKADCFLKLMS